MRKIKHNKGSTNIFKDLGFENPEESLAKAELARQIGKIIKKRKFTQKEAAEILGIDQPKVSALIRGKLRSFSLERLFRFLNDLGQDIKITISPAHLNHGHTWINDTSSKNRLSLGK